MTAASHRGTASHSSQQVVDCHCQLLYSDWKPPPSFPTQIKMRSVEVISFWGPTRRLVGSLTQEPTPGRVKKRPETNKKELNRNLKRVPMPNCFRQVEGSSSSALRGLWELCENPQMRCKVIVKFSRRIFYFYLIYLLKSTKIKTGAL